jgi:hypothetical protein
MMEELCMKASAGMAVTRKMSSARLHWLRGVFLAIFGADEARIEASFCAAINTAREQKSVSLEKRAEASYAEYCRQKTSGSAGRGLRLPLGNCFRRIPLGDSKLIGQIRKRRQPCVLLAGYAYLLANHPGPDVDANEFFGSIDPTAS